MPSPDGATMDFNDILKKFKRALVARYADRLIKVVVYGSYARGTASAESDLDLVLVFRDAARPSQEIDQIADLLAEFNLEYGVLISVVPVSLEAFQAGDGPFWRTVQQEGVTA
jgi:predicted nucleotidyltransferase